MFERRLVTALLDQVAVLTTAIEALKNNACHYNRGHEIENLLCQATSGMLQASSSLSSLERWMAAKESTKGG